jgi:hypothetical protein
MTIIAHAESSNNPCDPRNLLPSIDQRYASANAEKSARIQSRQTVQYTYTIIISGFVAFLAGEKNVNLKEIGDLSTLLISTGGALFGLVFAAWIGHQDLMIGLLDSYCLALEQYGEVISAEKPSCRVPSWHNKNSTMWLARGFSARFWSNHAFGLVLLATSLPNVIILYDNGYKRFSLLLFICLLLFTLSIRFYIMPRKHLHTLKWKYRSATIFLAISILIVTGALLFAINPVEPMNPRLNYPFAIGIVSILVSAATLTLYMWFERKRCLIFYDGSYDLEKCVFTYKKDVVKSAETSS